MRMVKFGNLTTLRSRFIGLAAIVGTVLSAPVASAQDTISWAGAGSGSASLAYAAAVAQIVNKHSQKVRVTVLPTAGAVEVVRLLDRGQVQAGVGNSATAYDAVAGVRNFEGAPVEGLSNLWTILRGATHVIVRGDSEIRDIVELRGKRIAVSPVGSTSYTQAIDMLRAYEIGEEEVTLSVLPFAEQVAALSDGTVDAVISGGWRSPNFQELATQIPVRFLPMSDEAWARLEAEIPPGYYVPVDLTPGMYKGQDEAVPTFTIVTFWLASLEGMDEDTAYEVVKTFWENKAEADAIHPMIADTDAEMQSLATPVPLHPGAERYFREAGILK